MVFKKFDPNIEWKELMPDGSKVKPGDVIAEFTG
jgi:nicotinate-nucleotide pyrophosphorylase (carboxylating)